ncbi:MAG: hypothetical protein ACR2QF_03085 [Geminicoccaceae bacterium]
MRAAAKIGFSHTALYTRRHNDEEFAAGWDAALAMGDKVKLARLEQEADRRGIEGYEKPIYQGGELVGSEQRYSDTLMIVRMKALAPEKYKDRVDTTVTAEINVNVTADYRDAIKEADALRGQLEHKRANGKGNGHANGNGHARSG